MAQPIMRETQTLRDLLAILPSETRLWVYKNSEPEAAYYELVHDLRTQVWFSKLCAKQVKTLILETKDEGSVYLC